MVEDVKHKWVHLDKLMIKILLELCLGEYEKYVLNDGNMIVELQQLAMCQLKQHLIGTRT